MWQPWSVMGDCWRTGSHQGQVPFQNIEKLRKLINAVISDKISNSLFDGSVGALFTAYDPGIEVQFEHHAVGYTVFFHQIRFSGFCIQMHAAEFIYLDMYARAKAT